MRTRRSPGAVEWTPPPEMLRIAKDRTYDITSVWVSRISDKLDLMALAESAYMQGINDCIDALIQTGWGKQGGTIWWP